MKKLFTLPTWLIARFVCYRLRAMGYEVKPLLLDEWVEKRPTDFIVLDSCLWTTTILNLGAVVRTLVSYCGEGG